MLVDLKYGSCQMLCLWYVDFCQQDAIHQTCITDSFSWILLLLCIFFFWFLTIFFRLFHLPMSFVGFIFLFLQYCQFILWTLHSVIFSEILCLFFYIQSSKLSYLFPFLLLFTFFFLLPISFFLFFSFHSGFFFSLHFLTAFFFLFFLIFFFFFFNWHSFY